MRSAFIATFIVTAGILLLMGILLSSRGLNSGMTSVEPAENPADPSPVNALSADFDYLDSCRKHVLKDFQTQDIFEKNKDQLQGSAVPMVIAAGKKLEKQLGQLAASGELDKYVLILEGNLNNEWEPRFDRNNTWAYQLSYNRALAVYKLWMKNGINIRKYPLETLFSGGGYYGLCPQKNPDSRRFSVQLVRRSEVPVR